MNAALEAESTLTYRYQTIVPETVHRALKLGKRDKLQYTIRPHGTVLIARAVLPEESAAVLYQFLGFLAADIARHPERIDCRHRYGLACPYRCAGRPGGSRSGCTLERGRRVMPLRSKPMVVNGWTIFAHPLFLDALEALIQQLESLRLKDPLDDWLALLNAAQAGQGRLDQLGEKKSSLF